MVSHGVSTVGSNVTEDTILRAIAACQLESRVLYFKEFNESCYQSELRDNMYIGLPILKDFVFLLRSSNGNAFTYFTCENYCP